VLKLVDTHAHLSSEQFTGDRAAVIERAHDAGVFLIVDVGVDLATSRDAVKLASGSTGVRAAVGVHPHEARTVDDEGMAALAELGKEPGVIAIGETGLDYYRELSSRESQRAAFDRHLALAHELDKPVIVHHREAVSEVLALIRGYVGKVRAVLHCYSGGVVALREALDLGCHISLGGPVTFKQASELREVAKTVPLDRLLLETDSPYLAPVPMRGRRNEPAYIVHVAETIAGLRGLTLSKVADATTRNVEVFFGVDQ